jgi:hypothetical protein
MPHNIEEKGLEILKTYLEKSGRIWTKSEIKTFDLMVDGLKCEVKTKGKKFIDLDFLSFTDKQFDEAQKGTEFIIFLVCNVTSTNENDYEIYEFHSSEFFKLKPKVYRSYEFNKKQIKELNPVNKLS